MNDNLKALGGLLIVLQFLLVILTVLFPTNNNLLNLLKIDSILIIMLFLYEKSLK